MTKAEERALEAYPVEIVGYTVECRIGATPEPQDWNKEKRRCYKEGYEQAEKDLALTWEDMCKIDVIMTDINTEREPKYGKEFYEEVFKRFKEEKK